MILSKFILTSATPLLILASAAECPPNEPDIVMTDPINVEGPLLTKPDSEMQSIRRKIFGTPLFGKEAVMGFTEVHTKEDHTVDYDYQQVGDSDEYCVVIKEVNVDFPLGLKIYLSPAYPEGTCEYDAANKHEQQHVDATSQIFNDYRIKLSDAIRDALLALDNKPMPHDNVDAYEKYIRETINEAVDPVYEDMLAEMEEANRGFDTRKEYKRLSKECP